MDMFELHNEKSIGFKRLSVADLGTGTSHQTHVGLSEKVLTYMPRTTTTIADTLFIYDDICDISLAFYDLIESDDGTFRSPKIRKGKKDEFGGREKDSVASEIREIAKAYPNDIWYLVYFGLSNELPVFILLKEGSKRVSEFRENGIPLKEEKCNDIINIYKGDFVKATAFLIQFLLSKIERITMQIEENLTFNNIIDFNSEYNLNITKCKKKKIKFDIDELKLKCKKIGRAGEILVNRYLHLLKIAGKIKDFNWVNEESESYFPYDVEILSNNNETFFLDVKSTTGLFTADFHFSDKELDFLSDLKIKDNYRIYRVYELSSDFLSAKLKILSNFSDYVDDLKTAKVEMYGVIRNVDNVSIGSMDCVFSPKEILFDSNVIQLYSNKENLEMRDEDLSY